MQGGVWKSIIFLPGADRGGSWGSGPPPFCQLRKKFKIVLNHHYYKALMHTQPSIVLLPGIHTSFRFTDHMYCLLYK